LARLSHRLSLTVIALLIFAGGTGLVFHFLPTSFVPAEDSGYYMIAVNEPPGATFERTMATLEKIASFLKGKNDPEKPKDEQLFQEVFTVTGFDILGNGQKSSAGVILPLCLTGSIVQHKQHQLMQWLVKHLALQLKRYQKQL